MPKKKKEINVEQLLFERLEVCKMLSIPESTFDKMRVDGTFPEGIRRSERKLFWHINTINDYIYVKSYESLPKDRQTGYGDYKYIDCMRHLGFLD